MDIEGKALSAVTGYLSEIENLKCYITGNDRTPLTDGHIDMHSGTPVSNANLVGRIQVQVKGRFVSGKMPVQTFRLDRTYLEGLRALHGAMLFVVSITASGDSTVSYVNLHPVRIDELLRTSKTKSKSFGVPLKPVPSNPEEFVRALQVAHKANQASDSGFDPELFQYVHKLNVVSANDLDFSRPFTLDTARDEVVVDFQTHGGFKTRLNGVISIQPNFELRKVDLKSGSIVFQQVQLKRQDGPGISLSPNSALKLEFDFESAEPNFSIVLIRTRSISDRLKALEFVRSLIHERQFQMDDYVVPLSSVFEPVSGIELEIPFLSSLIACSTRLHFDIELIDLQKIAVSQTLRMVCEAIASDGLIEGMESAPGKWFVDFGEWKILLFVSPSPTGSGMSWLDPFSPESNLELRMENLDAPNQPLISVTPYEVLEAGNLSTVLNLHLDNIVERYFRLSETDIALELASTKVLHLIAAADECPARSIEILTAARTLAYWVLEKSEGNYRMQINTWQIEARQGGLAKETLLEIRALRNEILLDRLTREDVLAVLAYSVLLRDQDDTEFWYNKLSENDREQFDSWPIAQLRKPELWGCNPLTEE